MRRDMLEGIVRKAKFLVENQSCGWVVMRVMG